MPSTVRLGQWRPSPRRHHSQCVQARLISPTTRLPTRLARVRLHDLGDELVPGSARKAVVAALQFQIGIADAARQQAQQRKALGTRRGMGTVAHRDTRRFPGELRACLYNRASCLRN